MTSPDSRELDVVIVTYNSERYIGALLDSLPAAGGGLALRVLIVDNGSSDRTVEIAKECSVEVVETGANLGYSGGINVARRVFGDGSMAILNPDLILAPGSLEIMVDALSENIGIVAPTIRDTDGSVFTHLRREPTVMNALGEGLFGARWPNRPRWLSDTVRRGDSYTQRSTVDWAGGAAWIISAECNSAVGDWDSKTYFLYSEETDYARRARELGFMSLFEPAAEVTHHGGGSGMSDGQLALMAVNRVRYFERYHHNRLHVGAFRAAVTLGHLLRARSSSAHRRAFTTLLSRRSWNRLPSAAETSLFDVTPATGVRRS